MEKLFKKRNNQYFFLFVIFFVFAQCSENVDSKLKSIAKDVNEKECPKMLDEYTRLDSCAALPNKTYKYYHTIQNLVVTDTTLIKANFAPQIVSMVKTDPQMKFFRENEVSLIYQYNGQNKNYLFSIIIAPEQYKSLSKF
ncbi:MAG: hypothetical protein E6767_04850 [Dysgonomonas sp.]|nr:hypothetical protein [Dysgonomonas sp.]